jgi:glutamyl/glutaminyl-tRNA synthetase
VTGHDTPGSEPGATVTGRLAPTPSGRLHLGNVCAFAAAWLSVRHQQGRLLLRIEDVDRPRARREVEDSIRRDLDWLGLHWDDETPRQSVRDYEPWLARVRFRSYYCTCTRAELAGSGGAYPGTCRDRGNRQGALRFRLPDVPALSVLDRARGRFDIATAALGDPVLQRRDGIYAYNLAVVADDIEDGVTEVVRGADLLEQSAAQACLWEVLGATPPQWLHAPLVLGADGRKLSKSHAARAVAALRDSGWKPADVWRLVLPWLGLPAVARIEDAVQTFNPARFLPGPIRLEGDAVSSADS